MGRTGQSCRLMSRPLSLYGRRQEVVVCRVATGGTHLSESGRYVGKLERAMYGIRDAPMICRDHLRETLLDMKFKESVTHPVCFNTKNTKPFFSCVHVDDLLCTGVRDDLLWLNPPIAEGVRTRNQVDG